MDTVRTVSLRYSYEARLQDIETFEIKVWFGSESNLTIRFRTLKSCNRFGSRFKPVQNVATLVTTTRLHGVITPKITIDIT
jgi:hypothetical protein